MWNWLCVNVFPAVRYLQPASYFSELGLMPKWLMHLLLLQLLLMQFFSLLDGVFNSHGTRPWFDVPDHQSSFIFHFKLEHANVCSAIVKHPSRNGTRLNCAFMCNEGVHCTWMCNLTWCHYVKGPTSKWASQWHYIH